MKTRYGMEIRAATGADAAGLAELLDAADQTIAAGSLAERLDNARRGPGIVLIAVDWGPPSGLIMAHWYWTLDADQAVAQITRLVVSPEKRRRGIGRLLIKAAAQAARHAGCDALEMLAVPEDQSLLAFCHATGFAGAGLRLVRALRKKSGQDLSP